MLFLGEISIPRPLIPKTSEQGDILKERLKQIREYTGLSQKEFSERIHIGASTLAMLETGDRKIKDLHISLICAAFDIDEHWFRTGEGDMLVHTVPNTIDQLAREFSLDDLDKKILGVYAQLPAQHRAVLKDYLVRLACEITPSVCTGEQLSIEEEISSYRKELLDEQKGTTSSPSVASGE